MDSVNVFGNQKSPCDRNYAAASASQSAEPDRDRIRLGAGVQMVFSQNLSGAIDYETVIGQNDFSDNAVKGEICYQF